MQQPKPERAQQLLKDRPGMTLFPAYRKGYSVWEVIEDIQPYLAHDSHEASLSQAGTSL